MFDLKDFRENKLKLTQAEFAKLINIRQDTVSRLETNPKQISLDLLVKIAQATGTPLDQLIDYKLPTPQALKINDSWKDVDFIKRTIVDYVDEKSKKYQGQWGNEYDNYINDLEKNINIIAKPKIAIVGHSDVGKSRLINSIIGNEKMPTAWTPTTSITVYIKHIQDRPSFIENEAIIFKASVDDNFDWDEKNLNDENYFKKWKLASGNAAILKDYGTRQGQEYEKNEAGSAVIFVESELLKVCDIMDLPGFGTGDRVEDDLMTLKAKSVADILIYMSHSGQFLQGSGIEYLKENIKALNVIENKKTNNLAPLSNLFIIGSQAHTIERGNLNSLKKILNNGCKRFFKTLPTNYFKSKSALSGYEYNLKVLENRFFTYTTDIDDLRKPFEDELKNLVETLPHIISEKSLDYIKAFVKTKNISLDNEINQYKNILAEKDKYKLILDELKEHEPIRINENIHRKNNLIQEIRKMKESSILNFSKEYNSFLTVDKIVEIINEKEFSKKKEDIQLLISFINSSLQDKVQTILQTESENLKFEIEEYLNDFSASIKSDKFANDFPELDFTFNSKEAFASGLVGLATFGGMALWAATLGNLGAYILVAKGVSILSMFGISLGGTAAVATGVAAIGGPIVLGIVLALITAISMFSFLSGGWKKSVAKKIIKEYNKNACENKFENIIKTFWFDTEIAFNKAADMLDSKWKSHLENIENIVSSYNIAEIQEKIKAAEAFKTFLLGIPLLKDNFKKLGQKCQKENK